MFVAPPSPTNTGGPNPTGGSSGDGKDKKLPLAPIIGGVVGGVVLISAIAVTIILLRRRKTTEHPAPITEPLPPTAIPQPSPGYVWDPQTQQYFLVNSPPVPDHIKYPHSPPMAIQSPVPFELGDK